jgi:two-component sensor histidine kinase
LELSSLIFSLEGKIIDANEASPWWDISARTCCLPFEKEYFREDGRRVPVRVGAALFQGSQNEGVAFVLNLTQSKETEKRRQVLLDELNHRVKNTPATVMSLSAPTFRAAESPEAFQEAFQGRLLALSQTHNLLNSSCWRGVSLRDIFMQELAPHHPASTELPARM